MATCPHAEHITPLLYDGELQNPLRREMITHLSSCVTCARIFSFLEREQELLSQTIEVQVDSVDFSNFWQGVAEKLSEQPASWGVRLRLWYESSRFMWSSSLPAWAAAAFLLAFLPSHVPPSTHDISLTPSPRKEVAAQVSPQNQTPSEFSQPTAQPVSDEQQETKQAAGPPLQWLLHEDQVQIDSLAPSVTVAIRINRENNATVVWVGDGSSGR